MEWRGQREAVNPVSRLRQSSKGKLMVAIARVVATDNCRSLEREKRSGCLRLHEYVQGEAGFMDQK